MMKNASQMKLKNCVNADALAVVVFIEAAVVAVVIFVVVVITCWWLYF